MDSAMETVAPLRDIIQEIEQAGGEAFRFCYQCGKCDTLCPWNRVRDFSIRKLVRQASLGLPEIELEDIWRCTSCGLCPSQCPRGVQQVEVGVAIRRIATEYGVFSGSAKAIRTAAGSILADGNPLREDRSKRADWAEGLGVPAFTEDMEILYFVGCYFAYDPRMRKVARATVRLLKRAGVRFGTLGTRESCCGESIRRAGNEEAFKATAKENIKAFIDAGVTRILVSSPHCYHTFRREYPELRVSFDIVHITEYLRELQRAGRLDMPSEHAPVRVTYHDPCYLGRHNGVYDAPRELLEAIPGVSLVEMANSGENSLCCGGGGGRIWMDTPKGERFADLRMAQAEDVGAEILATACPYCMSNFEESRLSRDDATAPRVMDVTELLVEALSGGEVAP